MANEQNLVKGDDIHKFTLEEASRGGKASGEARRRKKSLKEAFNILLEREVTDKNGNVVIDKDGNTLTGAEAIGLAVYKKAIKGDLRAVEILRDTAGQRPTDKVHVEHEGATTALDALIKQLEAVKHD